jgi:hypothetical protein
MVFDSPFSIGQRVNVDECRSIVARITALCWREICFEAEISWWTDGELRTAWVAMSRLSPAGSAEW